LIVYMLGVCTCKYEYYFNFIFSSKGKKMKTEKNE
jgi:hypothetical protein